MREIALHILDIAQNSVTAGARNVKIEVVESRSDDKLCVTIIDDGCGMTPEFLKNVTSPFTTKRTTRKVGLGIPLFKAAAELAGGSFKISSEVNIGTQVKAVFGYSHIDRQPLGNMAETMLGLITSYEKVDFLYIHKVEDKEFELDTAELKKILGDIPFSNPEVYLWLSEYISEGERSLE